MPVLGSETDKVIEGMDQKFNDNQMQNRFTNDPHDPARFELPNPTQDFFADKIMDNIHNTPLGRLLGIIAALPEIRQEKVEQGRRICSRKDAELDDQLDAAMDRVLEELLHEG
jgi:hypothetical protein